MRKVVKNVGREVSKELVREAGRTMKWGGTCALVGATALGVLGLWKFGLTGLGIGIVAGAVVGGVGGIILYVKASSLI